MGMVLNTYWLSFAWFQFVDRLPFKIISILQVRLVIQLYPNFRRIVNVLSFVQKKHLLSALQKCMQIYTVRPSLDLPFSSKVERVLWQKKSGKQWQFSDAREFVASS